jgi:tetratricopeptide (TPR) repeat protein
MALRRRTRILLLVLLSTGYLPPAARAQADNAAALRKEAGDLAYNLDHAQAVALLRRAIAAAPDDPAAHRALANVLWLNILFQRGAVTVDHYLGSFSRSTVDLPKPPADLDAEFREHVAKAIDLAERRVAAHPNDARAHYDLGAAVGLRASYVATVDGRLLAGFNAARRAFDEEEKALRLDPSLKEAGLIVGTYRYIVSTLSLPMRFMAYVVGFGGGRERGIAMLEEAAASTGEGRSDALFALVLVYNRERRYDDALRVLQELRRLHPRNRLVVLEAGSTALRARRPQLADTLLTEGLAMLEGEKRPRIPGEEQLWRYKRGAARVAEDRIEPALGDLRFATTGDGLPWVQGRARIELARVALKRGDSQTADGEARQAQTLCERGRDPVCVNEARKVLRGSDVR